MRSISPLSGGSVCALAMAAAVPLTNITNADGLLTAAFTTLDRRSRSRNAGSCSFDRTYTGTGRRCRQASVQAIVLPLPRHWAGRQNQARPSAQPHRWPQERHTPQPPEELARGKKQESHWAWLAPATRLTSCLMRVDWPAQPYRNLAQRPFQSYLIKCLRSCFVYWNRPNQLAHRSGQQMPPSSCSPSRQLRTASRFADHLTVFS
jgi:hypothetical protein